ncbi:MAG: CCA tRNA nucleotidyltransferase [Enterococcus sp.]|nr:CCA tRNA nucleotidyltransferase [Enterococcus sp.]
MCQKASEGGRRCTPGITAAQRRNMVRRLNRLNPDSQAHTELSERIENLDKAREEYGACVTPLDIPVPEGVHSILDTINSKGYTPLLVGGTVRDAMIGGTTPKDFDIEVYGANIDTLAKSLRSAGYRVDEVGKSFGVLKVTTKDSARDDIDISVPRRDSLVGAGHRGFEVEMDAEMSVEEASQRRDFTFNALMWDYRYQAVIDPHNGTHDLQAGVLRHVSDAFAEDPLRSLRGFQFASRFNMTMDPETSKFCQNLYPQAKDMAVERIATEWQKFYHKAKHPSQGMKALRDMGWSGHAPGLEKVNTKELGAKLDRALEVSQRDNLNDQKKTTLLAATIMRGMDDTEAEGFARATLIGKENQRLPLHLRSANVQKNMSDYEVKRLAQHLSKKELNIADWARYEDLSGDKNLAQDVLGKAHTLHVADHQEEPYLQGRNLLPMTSRKPGKWVSHLLAEAEEKQYRGEFANAQEALAWAKAKLG